MLAPVATGGYEIGDTVSDFKLMNVNDKMVSMSDYTDTEGLIIVFTSNYCKCSRAWEGRIMELDKKFRPLGYPVIAINPNSPEIVSADSFEKMQIRAKEMNYTFAYLSNETGDVAKTFGATKTPTAFVLHKVNNEYKLAYKGAIDDNMDEPDSVQYKYVEMAVEALKKGELPNPNSVKGMGCSIVFPYKGKVD
ncbi:MAG: thioredoxin family protein [Fimbriimonadaceae bacterium]|nr:thioredoxin family protein [Chitinophagales bacterium]